MSPSSAQFDKTPEGNTPPRSSLPLAISGTTRLLALLGDPVGHSLSPAMHNAALAAAGIDAAYMALPVKPENLGAAIAGLRAVNFMGANVTLPHKSAVIPFLDEISPLARTLGAVNTIVNRDGKLYGDTTDAAGFIAAFEDEGHSFDGAQVAILGNGGSARTIATALPLMRKVSRITLVARNLAKAEALIEEIRSALGDPANAAVAPDVILNALTVDQYARVAADHALVVNTTPVGMTPLVDATPLPAEHLHPHQIVYDIVYNPVETRLLREAKAAGCRVLGGLGMLVYQGKIAFEQWTARAVPARIFLEGIRLQQSIDMNHTRQENGEPV
jgi:shikimate dehydrogenase